MATCAGLTDAPFSSDFTDKIGNPRYWYDCGIFTFDGMFNNITFKKGTMIYHGSARLASFNVEMPLGKMYYTLTNENALKAADKTYLRNPEISDQLKRKYLDDKLASQTFPGWFGDLGITL